MVLTPENRQKDLPMKLLEDREWPAELREELERQINAADAPDVFRAAERCPAIGRTFRLDKANLPRFRRNLLALALGNPSESDLEMLRWCTFWKDVVCVLSVKALTDGFDAMAAFLGGAKLVAGMLVDPREEVRRKALSFLDSGAPFPPVPDDPEAARALLCETFEPFVRAFSAASVAPQVTHIDRTDEDREQIRRLNAALEEQRAQLSAAAQARRDAERKQDETALALRRAEADAAQARAEADAERATRADAETRLAGALSDTAALRDELLRRDNEIRTLQSFRDECLRLRERASALAADNESLRAGVDAAHERIGELETAARDTDAALLRASVEAAPVPEAPRATPRDRLAALTYPDPLPAGNPLRILIDGHNVLNVAPEYVAMATTGPNPPSHEALRDDLQHRIVALAGRLAPCEIDLYFDGPVANLYTLAPGVRLHFSGGTGDHRADNVILGDLAFYAQQGGASFLTVTEDADIAAEALRLGSRTVRSADFAQLLFS